MAEKQIYIEYDKLCDDLSEELINEPEIVKYIYTIIGCFSEYNDKSNVKKIFNVLEKNKLICPDKLDNLKKYLISSFNSIYYGKDYNLLKLLHMIYLIETFEKYRENKRMNKNENIDLSELIIFLSENICFELEHLVIYLDLPLNTVQLAELDYPRSVKMRIIKCLHTWAHTTTNYNNILDALKNVGRNDLVSEIKKRKYLEIKTPQPNIIAIQATD